MWNKVSVGFDAEEETANFGTRACAVNDVAVYETNTLAAILSGDEVSMIIYDMMVPNYIYHIYKHVLYATKLHKKSLNGFDGQVKDLTIV